MAEVTDNKTNVPDNEEESVKECEGEEEKEEITLNKALEMADKLKNVLLKKKKIHDVHPQLRAWLSFPNCDPMVSKSFVQFSDGLTILNLIAVFTK